MRIFIALLAAFTLSFSSVAHAAQSRVPSVETYKAMLAANKPTGWVAFREYSGKQIVYFSTLVSMRCGLDEIRYSINSDALDQRFEMVDCIPALPFSMPSDAPIETTLIFLKPGEAKSIAIQVLYKDGTESEVLTYEPCEGVGDQTCAYPVE